VRNAAAGRGARGERAAAGAGRGGGIMKPYVTDTVDCRTCRDCEGRGKGRTVRDVRGEYGEQFEST
jgi:hypothetical protein